MNKCCAKWKTGNLTMYFTGGEEPFSTLNFIYCPECGKPFKSKPKIELPEKITMPIIAGENHCLIAEMLKNQNMLIDYLKEVKQ